MNRIRIEVTFDIEPGPDEAPMDTTANVVMAIRKLRPLDNQVLLAFAHDPIETMDELGARKAAESGLTRADGGFMVERN